MLVIRRARIHNGGGANGVRTVQVRELPSLKVLDTFVTKSGGSYETHTVKGGNADKIRLHFVDNHGDTTYMIVQHVEFFGF